MSYQLKQAAMTRALWLEGDYKTEQPIGDDGPRTSDLLDEMATLIESKNGDRGLIAEARRRVAWLLSRTPEGLYEQMNRARKDAIDCYGAPSLLRRLAEAL